MLPFSVYVHFPYCLAKCPYCDFVSYKTARETVEHAGYADAVIRELHARAPGLVGRKVETVFFGGGTPSLWDPKELGRVFAAVRDHFEVERELEVTVECNPTSLDRTRAEELLRVGVNRLSIGVQSLRPEALRFLGRLHNAEGGLAAVQASLEAGFSRVSADLMFGLADQTPEDAALEASTLAALGLRHLSAYQLTIEPGTRFGELAKAGRLPRADDERTNEAFFAIEEKLASQGLHHYEISNYAAKGEEARHNLGYWRGQDYLGLGAGAIGCFSTDAKIRYRNQVDPAKYMRALLAEDYTLSWESLSPLDLLRERIMLGLRLRNGFSAEGAARELGVEFWTRDRERAAEKLIEKGRLERHGELLRIPPAAWIWTDDTAARLF